MTRKKIIFITALSLIILTGIYYTAANFGFFGGGTNAPSVPEDTMTRGLVGYWEFEEGTGQTAYDASGNSNDGTLGVSSSVGSDDPVWGKGKNGGALEFDGVDDYVDAGNSAEEIYNVTNVTVVAWIKPSGLGEDYQEIVDTSYPGPTPNSLGYGPLNYNKITGKVKFSVKNGVNGEGGSITSSNPVNINQWSQVVGRYDGTDITIYINGNLEGTVYWGKSIASALGKSTGRIGVKYDPTSRYFNGSIDSVRIYNRALTADEVRYHYNRGGPVGSWNFDEGSGLTAFDSTSNNNDGSLTNFGTTDTGTATAGSSNTLTDGVKAWSTDQWADGTITTTGGTGSGQSRTISSNTGTIITVSSNWTTNPDATTTYSLTQAPTFTTGKHGTAIQFDGVDDYVDCGNDESLNITGELTMSAWVWLNATHDWQQICGRGYNTAGDYWLAFDTGTSRPYAFVDGVIFSTAGNDELSLDEWHHIALSAKVGTDNLKMYVNGKLYKTLTTSTDVTGNSIYNFWIGRDDKSNSYEFDGSIDSVRIYDYARSADEIRLDYNVGVATHLGPSGKTCSEDPAGCMDYGLVGSWGMDEGTGTTAYDASDEGNDGSLMNGPVWGKGKEGGGLEFDGVDDYVDCGSGESLDITGALTVGLWMKSTDITAGLISKSNDAKKHFGNSVDKVYELGILNNVIYWQISNGTTTSVASGSANSLVDNNWHYIVVYWDGTTNTNGLKIYKDGVVWHQDTSTISSIQNLNSVLDIGGYGAAYPLNGSIDSVRIYNRALSAEEVRYHYNKGGPVAEWGFDEGSGTVVHDESGNEFHGVLNE